MIFLKAHSLTALSIDMGIEIIYTLAKRINSLTDTQF